MNTSNTEARRYELMLVLKADSSDDAIRKHIDSIKKLVTDQGGEFVFEDVWGRRDLAYRIKKEEVGYYIVFNFTIEGKHLKEIEETLRLDQNLLRYLLFKTPANYEITEITEADLEWSKKIKKDDEEEKEEEKEEKKPVVKKEKIEKEIIEEAPEEEETEEVEEEVEEEDVEDEEIEEEEAPEEEEEVEEIEEEEIEEKEEKEKKKKEEAVKQDEKKTMEDLDEKLKAIMNDTDIDISL